MPDLRRVRIAPIVLVLALLFVACAAHPKPYVVAGQVTLTVSTILQQASAAADAAYAQQGLTGFSGHDLNTLRATLEPIAVAVRDTETALIAWPTDGPAPPQVQRLVAAIGAGVTNLTAQLPDSPTKTALIGFLTSARVAAQAILDYYAGGVA